MYIIRGLHNLPPRYRGAAVTIGNFDGVHRGHQSLFRHLRELAEPHDAPVMALTFEPHPRSVLTPDNPPPRITALRGKARWLDAYGLDAVMIMHFSRDLMKHDPEAFVREILVQGLGVKEVLVGRGFRFGARGAGGIAELQSLGAKYGFAAHDQELLDDDGAPVSSTRIRDAVIARDFVRAANLLGRPFEVEARVCGGQKRGRALGFPTANLNLHGLLHPPPGVYVVEGRIRGRWWPAVANVGRNPTFGDEGLHLEAHMLTECGDLYGRSLRVRFRKHLRDEVRFPNVEALKAQIAQDVATARKFFNMDDATRAALA
ncbi:bifunctional riboflavin kinase/FAD synthetase [Magnetofaba australis]|uniref:Riboflavin biosynthesis protein n=1 Tax=Magnetofaba australis IT-1 TaxID=1434232 RepID=A0A1Y2K7I8_9PROT|nr:bifunctional riboflavin kinase/FAD synthetase [Magnetofaba australis]OSM04342.1 putative riboflavin kinase/FMN adenylyltransferase [Magnetofaba australis IT-1]